MTDTGTISPAQAKRAIAERERRDCPNCGRARVPVPVRFRPVVIEMDGTEWRCLDCWHLEYGPALIEAGYTKVERTP